MPIRAMGFRILIAACLTVLLPGLAWGADDAARRAQLAQNERDAARQVRDYDAGLVGDYFRLGAFITDDVALLKGATEGEAVVHERIAAAIERGANEEEVKRLRTEQEAATKARMMYRERITEWRSRQFTAAPSEQWFQEYGRWSRAGIPELLAWGEARKAAAEAWGRVAEGLVPGYDADALDNLKEEAYRLDTEREIAEMRFNWAREREQVLQSDKRVTPDGELVKRVEELKRLQEERIKIKRLENERQREVRRLDRSIRSADAAFRKAWESAQRAAEERARNGKR